MKTSPVEGSSQRYNQNLRKNPSAIVASPNSCMNGPSDVFARLGTRQTTPGNAEECSESEGGRRNVPEYTGGEGPPKRGQNGRAKRSKALYTPGSPPTGPYTQYQPFPAVISVENASLREPVPREASCGLCRVRFHVPTVRTAQEGQR